MTRETLDRQIQHIQDEVLLLGSMVEQSMLNAVNALKRRDIETSKTIFDEDRIINEKRYAIENAILILIATQQPIAHDLRKLTAMLELITELERMGDYAKGIAKVTIHLKDVDIAIPTREFDQMANLAVSMLHRALGAFVSENFNQASQIPKEDEEVDALYEQIYHKLINAMIANPSTIDPTNQLMWVAHNLERMADRVTNICERTVFIATGELMEMDINEDSEDED